MITTLSIHRILFTRFVLAVFLCAQLFVIVPQTLAGEVIEPLEEASVLSGDALDNTDIVWIPGMYPVFGAVDQLRYRYFLFSKRAVHRFFAMDQNATGPPV